MRSSAIQGVQNGSEKAARPPEGCPAETGGLFGPESTLGFDHPSGTNARQPSQKAGERFKVPLIVHRFKEIKFVRMWVTLKPSLLFNWVKFSGGFSVPSTEI